MPLLDTAQLNPGMLESGSFVIALSSLAPTQLRLKRQIPVTIRFTGDDYIASFYDANLHASGDSDQEAFDGLRERLIDTFEILDRHDPAKLGPGPKRQLAVLRELIERA